VPDSENDLIMCPKIIFQVVHGKHRVVRGGRCADLRWLKHSKHSGTREIYPEHYIQQFRALRVRNHYARTHNHCWIITADYGGADSDQEINVGS
jgi:hypothetical protein